jgi:glucose-6-phosphate 1-dehydrogenase
MLALLCIEPPLSLTDANSIRDEKVKVLRSLRRFTPEDIRGGKIIRGQYASGAMKGESALGYLEEKGVASGSTTETFIALELEIDTWRWSGVPVFVRVGKRMPRKITELTIHFKKAPGAMFRGREEHLEENVLSIQIQPNEGISLKILSKPPGPGLEVQPVVMDFNYGHSFRVSSADAYERLILDSMKGDATLFIRDDEIEEAWSFLEPVLKEWRDASKPVPLYQYPAGSWGPTESDRLLAKSGRRWRAL